MCFAVRLQMKLRNTSRQASKPTSEPAAADAGAQPEGPSDAQQSSSGSGGASAKTAHASRQASESVQASEAAGAITQLAVLIVRYCRQLWAAVSGAYGEVEAGQVLGYHFSEACQVSFRALLRPQQGQQLGSLPCTLTRAVLLLMGSLCLLHRPSLLPLPAWHPAVAIHVFSRKQ